MEGLQKRENLTKDFAALEIQYDFFQITLYTYYFRQKLKMTDLAPEIREQVQEVMRKDCVTS